MRTGTSSLPGDRYSLMRLIFISCLVLPLGLVWSRVAVAQDGNRPWFGISLRASLLEQRFKRTRNEEEAVAKLLMNSNVTGTQSTVTETRLRILPDESSLKFELLNSGDVTSQTTGFNPQATVDSVGNHHFEITKPMWFDGARFLTRPAHGTIQASQKPQRVVSTVGATMPLLGRLSDRVAWTEVLRRTPLINQVVAEDVSRDVLPRIDKSIDKEFADLQRQWTSLQNQVQDAFGSSPLAWNARSGEQFLAIWADSVATTRTLVPKAASDLRAEDDIVVFVSEDAMNALVARYVPAGIQITDTQLQKIAEVQKSAGVENSLWSPDRLASILTALRTELSSEELTKREATLFSLELAPQRPLEIQFVDGDVRLTANFQIHPKIGGPSGWMAATFNLRGKRISPTEWIISTRSVDVGQGPEAMTSGAVDTTPAVSESLIIPSLDNEFPADAAEADDKVTTVQAGTVWMPIIRNAVQTLAEKLPPVKLPVEFDGEELVAGAPAFRIARIDSSEGLLKIVLRTPDRKAKIFTENRSR